MNINIYLVAVDNESAEPQRPCQENPGSLGTDALQKFYETWFNLGTNFCVLSLSAVEKSILTNFFLNSVYKIYIYIKGGKAK